ncbi:MAG: DNA methylase [Chloroflexota bacterium]|nr:MAG: DNA methylase [Chloroflexota bacterium]
MTQPKRLIEISLPLAKISEQSAREKSIRHGHISTLHIWWARRPLAAMRAAIFAALVPAPTDETERKRLESLIETIVDWDQVKDGNSEAVEEARRLIQQAFPGGPPRLLDPFMGGGATGLEALRLGCETHAVELNPVAHLIELCTLVYPQKYGRGASPTADHRPQTAISQFGGHKQMALPGHEQPEQLELFGGQPSVVGGRSLAADVRRWGEWVLERAKAEIGHLYANPAGSETIVGYLWARTVTCPNPACRAEMPMVRQWWLAQTGTRKLTLKPVVDRAAKQVNFEVVNLAGSPGHEDEFDPNEGTTRQGAATCLVCNQSVDGDFLQQAGMDGKIGQRLMAVIYEQPNAGKGYRPAATADEALFKEAVERLQQLQAENEGLVPDEPIDPRRPSAAARGLSAVTRYGMRTFGNLFNPRQLTALLTFSFQIRAAYDAMLAEKMPPDRAKTVATYLALTLNRNADYNSSLCPWANNGEYAGHTFTRQALSMIWDYAELNPFSGATGDWSGALAWITLVVEHVAQVSNWPATAHQGTATRLSYPENYFDAIITDPPYYDAIPYSDLSDFFYVWLKRSIGFLYPELFRTPLSPKSAEIIQHTARHDGDESLARNFYEREMTRAFAEARRVLRPNGTFVVVFAHKSTAAWETLLNSLLEADLVVTASWPLHTEMSNRARARDTASLASSIFIVCRVRASETEGYFDDVRQELAAVIRERLDFFWQQNIRGADFFISAIGPAVSVFGRYRKVYRLDGSEVGVRELLDLVQSSVAEYALDRILNGGAARVGGVDAATRYYILHRWAYGSEAVPFDDGMRLAMALGADVSALMERRGLLKQSGESVSLLGPKERGKSEELGLPDKSGRSAAVVDVLHRAASLWEKGDRDSLARFLAEAARGREDQVRLVAQTIINILPDDDAERRLLEGFLAGRDTLPDVPRQERLL